MALPSATIGEPSSDWVPLTDQIIIYDPQVRECITIIQRCHRFSKRLEEPLGVKVWGDVGTGKSFIQRCYEQSHRLVDAHGSRLRKNGHKIVPVCRAVVPDMPTRRTFVASLLEGLEDPAYDAERSAWQAEQRLYRKLEETEAKLILLDEMNHLVDKATKNVAPEVADWMKHFHYKCKISIVAFGLPSAEKVFDYEPQLLDRFGNAHYLKPFRWDKINAKKMLAGYLKKLDERQPFAYIGLADPDITFRIWLATRGYRRRIAKLLKGAVEHGVDEYEDAVRRSRPGRRYLIMKDFEIAFDRYIQRCPQDEKDLERPAANPFRNGKLPCESAVVRAA
ncbi:MAG: TniB protein [Rhodospirillales bacterium]|nr:TniB protein [Rhodospirillales bacterium]